MTTEAKPAEIDDTTVGLRLDDRDEVEALLEAARDQQALLLRLDQQPAMFVDHEVAIEAPDFDFRFTGRPVQVFERAGGCDVVFQVEPWPVAKQRELERKLAAGDVGAEGEVRGTSPAFRIKAMNPNERARLAMKASKTERQLLRRDGSPQVLLNLLSNPRVEAEDVLAIVKSTHTNAGLLDRVAKDRRWSRNVEIRTAVVKNPKTPSPTAIRLLESLRTEDLRQLARIGALRETVRREALRVYMKRTGQR